MQRSSSLNSSHLLAGGAAVFVLVLLLIWHLGTSAQSAPAQSQNALTVAIIGLIGTLFTGAITFAGVVLKDAVDRRSAMLQADAENRLRMETALKAIELITKGDAEGAPAQESREAAVMVISSLDQHDLALALAEKFLSNGKISPQSFVQVASQCLDQRDDSLDLRAGAALLRHHEKLAVGPENLEFPLNYCFKWHGQSPFNAKHDMLEALIRVLLSKPSEYWDINIVNGVIYTLYVVFTSDTDLRIKVAAAALAADLCDACEPFPGYGIMPLDRHSLTYGEIRTQARHIMSAHDGDRCLSREVHRLIRRISEWKPCKDEVATTGSAAKA